MFLVYLTKTRLNQEKNIDLSLTFCAVEKANPTKPLILPTSFSTAAFNLAST